MGGLRRDGDGSIIYLAPDLPGPITYLGVGSGGARSLVTVTSNLNRPGVAQAPYLMSCFRFENMTVTYSALDRFFPRIVLFFSEKPDLDSFSQALTNTERLLDLRLFRMAPSLSQCCSKAYYACESTCHFTTLD
jgi:hypothetical protein